MPAQHHTGYVRGFLGQDAHSRSDGWLRRTRGFVLQARTGARSEVSDDVPRDRSLWILGAAIG